MAKILIYLLFIPMLFAKAKGPTDRAPIGDYISPDAFRGIAHFVFEGNSAETGHTFPRIPNFNELERMIISDLLPGDIIYVSIKCLEYFIENVHPKISNPYILLCTNDDRPVFDKKYLSYINDPMVINCYVRNINIDHPKVQPIPVGIENKFFLPYFPDEYIQITSDLAKYNPKRNGLAYMNLWIDNFKEERLQVWMLFRHKSFVKQQQRVRLNLFLRKLKETTFCISPAGNGVECHRTWEALYMGNIPIIRPMTKAPTVQHAVGYDKLYHDLPVIMVSSWKQVTNEFLERKLEEFKDRKFNMKKLYFPYWKNLILGESEQYKIDIDK